MLTIINCPSCGNAYEIPDLAALRGRKVRCVNCAAVWRIEQPETAVQTPAIAAKMAADAMAVQPPVAGNGATDAPIHEKLNGFGNLAGSQPPTASSKQDLPFPWPKPEERSVTIALTPGRAAAIPAAPANNREPGQATVTERRRLGRRQNGFDEVEAAIAALQTTIKVPPALQTPPPPSNVPLPPDRAPDPFVRPRETVLSSRNGPLSSPGFDGFSPPNEDFQTEAPRYDREAPTDGEPASGKAGLIVAWALVFAVIAGTGALAWFERVTVVRVLPAAASIYAALGAPVNARGLEFSGVDAQWQSDTSGRPVLSLTGQVKNVTHDAQTVPSVVLAFRDGDGRELFDWATTVPTGTLAAGETMPFTTIVPAPPMAVRELEIRFAKQRR